ncbi:GspE/PulE family protein [Photobacterium leiognathi]|uniref:GspE/PulE family protein n=1 Tax=Photobacterium leiognathi TaxID=553611 RepID=UPI002982192D|nr:ATPase, T2SS/T4P/T4SS family [Photobacterium leiognathi]
MSSDTNKIETKIIRSIDELPRNWSYLNIKKLDDYRQKHPGGFAFLECMVNHNNSKKLKYILVIRRDFYRQNLNFSNEVKGICQAKSVADDVPIAFYFAESVELMQQIDDTINSTFVENNSDQIDSDIKGKVETFIKKILAYSPSDIHIRSYEKYSDVRIRVKGVLLHVHRMSGREGLQWQRHIYQEMTVESRESFNPKLFQFGLIKQDIGGISFRGRLDSAPLTPNGCGVVIRVIDDENSQDIPSIDELNYSPINSELIRNCTNIGSGLILLTGTTGSGKSKTLWVLSSLKLVSSNYQIKMQTVEDPVEAEIYGADQMTVTRTDDPVESLENFNKATRALLRQDPDWMLFGEIRDADTAKTVNVAVRSGHPVLSTLHTDGAYSVIPRLIDISVPRKTLASKGFLQASIYQKLLPKLCSHCSRDFDGESVLPQYSEYSIVKMSSIIDESVLLEQYEKFRASNRGSFVRYLLDKSYITNTDVNVITKKYKSNNSKKWQSELVDRINSVRGPGDKVCFKGDGCDKCNFTGIAGRIPVAEVLIPDEEMRALIDQGLDNEAQRYWRVQLGGVPIMNDAIYFMKKGLIDPCDIELTLGAIKLQ